MDYKMSEKAANAHRDLWKTLKKEDYHLRR